MSILRATVLSSHDRLRDIHGESCDCEACLLIQSLADIALSEPVALPGLDVERLARALIDLFPAGQRVRWPFSVEEMAAAIAARLASSEPTP